MKEKVIYKVLSKEKSCLFKKTGVYQRNGLL